MTEEEKIADLLKKRYKVIADFPHNDYKVGDIVNGEPWENNWGVDFKDYPAIFKPLEWWEGREEKDMPEYLKSTFENKTTYCRIIKWDMEFMVGYMTETQVCSIRIWKPEYGYFPATELEYLNQK